MRTTTWMWIVLVLAVIGPPLVMVSCVTMGISDPEVREAGYDVAGALLMVNEDADNSDLVVLWADLAKQRATKYAVLDKKLTDLDKVKIKRLQEGMQTLIDRSEDEDYVRARSFTLAQLAVSVGLYSQEGLTKIREMLKEIKGDQSQTQPGGNDGREGTSEGTSDNSD